MESAAQLEKDAESEAQRMLGEGLVPIAASYRVESWPPASPRQQPLGDAEETKSGGELEPSLKKSRRSGRRGKKGRRGKSKHPWLGLRPGAVPPAPNDLCHAWFNKGECRFGEKCRKLHDVEQFLRMKEEDVKGECYVFAQYGECKEGIRCRFAGSHVRDGKNVVDEEKKAQRAAAKESAKLNNLTRPERYELQKKRAQFPKAEEVRALLKKRDDARSLAQSKLAPQERANFVFDEASAGWMPHPRERKLIDFSNLLYLAPLTTIGNLPFRRVCVELGADITCGEMAMSRQLLAGEGSEWALVQRHASEKIFGVQLCGRDAVEMARCAEYLDEHCQVDFIDINCGCPIDVVAGKGLGSGLLQQKRKMRDICVAANRVVSDDVAITIKMRTGWKREKPSIQKFFPELHTWGVSAVAIHGRTREQRYTAHSDWDYIKRCAELTSVPVIGNGDVYDWTTYYKHKEEHGVASCLLARGAIFKPWIFTEIKERRTWDISSSERFAFLQRFANYGLEHWGSDWQGVEKTRQFMLQWLSFLHRYVPVGVVERGPVEMTHRPVPFVGRDDLETLMASPFVDSWIKITEMMLGPVPAGFRFEPKHKSNAWKLQGSRAAEDWG